MVGEIKSSEKWGHFLINSHDLFLQPVELNPADIRKNAGIRHLCIGFTFQAMKLHSYLIQLSGWIKKRKTCLIYLIIVLYYASQVRIYWISVEYRLVLYPLK